MSNYKSVFRELQFEIWKVAFLNSFLNAALAFFAANVVLVFVRERSLYALIPAVIVFLWSFIATVRKYTLRRIEENNPEVSEILRTAHDNKSGDNLMVHALFLELMQKMETVSAGAFLSSTKLIGSLIAIAILAPAPVLLHQCAAYCTIDNPLEGMSLTEAFTSPDSPLAPVLPIDDAGDRDIYGDQDVVQLGNEKFDITAASGGGGIDFTTTQDASGRTFSSNPYGDQVEAQQTDAGTGGNHNQDTNTAICTSCLSRGNTLEQCQQQTPPQC